MAPQIRRLYDQMAEPKWVIGMGACGMTAGFFGLLRRGAGVQHIVPVDVYLPGCPPRLRPPECHRDVAQKIRKTSSRVTK